MQHSFRTPESRKKADAFTSIYKESVVLAHICVFIIGWTLMVTISV